MISLILIVLFEFIRAKSGIGFLYSPITNSFICTEVSKDSKETIPLKFVIEVPDEPNKSPNSKFYQNFEITEINGRPGNGNKISINNKGEVKLYKGQECETAYEDDLRAEICSDNYRQIFIWIPEKYFTEFVKIIEERLNNENQNKGKRRSPKKDVKQSLRDIKNLLKSKQNTTSKDCQYNEMPIANSNGFKDLMLSTYLWAYCLGNPRSSACNSMNMKNQKNCTDQMCLDKNNCINNSYDEYTTAMSESSVKILDKINSIFKDAGIATGSRKSYESDKKRPRPRGYFGKGEDSDDMKINPCGCKEECVKNPKNGACFYTYSPGGLIPILKNNSCCEKNKGKICNFENKIEQYLCELSVKNDYSSHSKFLDDNFISN